MKEITKKVKELQNYYKLHNGSYDGFADAFRELEAHINTLPESKEKHSALASVYFTASRYNDEFRAVALREAELGENASVMANIIINANLHDCKDSIIEESKTAIPKIKKMPDTLENRKALCYLFYWSAANKFSKGFEWIDTALISEAKKDFCESAIYADNEKMFQTRAEAAIKAIDIFINSMNKWQMTTFCAYFERLTYKNGNLVFCTSSGFGDSKTSENRFADLLFYLSVNSGQVLFGENMGIGDEIPSSEKSGNKTAGTLTLINQNESVKISAGEFNNCLKYKIKSMYHDAEEPFTADAYYAPCAGLVKAVFMHGGKSETYELCEYKINGGGSGSLYFPLSKGNVFRYRNTDLSDDYMQYIEYEVTGTGVGAGTEIFADFSVVILCGQKNEK